MLAGDRHAVMDSEALAEWEELAVIDPHGPERTDLAIGVLCSLLDACHRVKGRTARPVDYMPYLKVLVGPEPEQPLDEMKAAWSEWANA